MQDRLNEILSSPLVLPASVAGALAALFVVLAIIAWRRAQSQLFRPLGGLAFGILVILAVVYQISVSERAQTRRALISHEADLTRSALSPGSFLPCLDAGAGDMVEAACEKSVFASAQTVATAVIYISARLNLLALAGPDENNKDIRTALASTRRAVELDRFGVAAHVLATRDGCTADRCAAFDLVDDASALRANLKAQVFDQYVSRYMANWKASPQPVENQPAVSSIPAAPRVTGTVSSGGGAPVAAIKPGEQWDYPSAASIPAVSIMNAESPPKKDAEAAPQAPAVKPAARKADVGGQTRPAAPAAKPAGNAAAPLALVPPIPPQLQAAPPATR